MINRLQGKKLMMKPLRLGLVLLAFAALIAAACTPPQTSSTAEDRAAAVSAYNAVYLPALAAVASGAPTQAPAGVDINTCTAGTADLAFEANTLALVNYYRQMVGLNTVTLDPGMSAVAQQAAMVHANGKIDLTGGSHYPFASNNDCVMNNSTDLGEIGARRSNLSWGATTAATAPARRNGPRGVEGQMRDNGNGTVAGTVTGSGNEEVGHRRAILSPLITRVGSGSAAVQDPAGTFPYHSTQALYWMDPTWFTNPADANSGLSGAALPARPTNIDFVAWPPPGWVPEKVVYPRWSFSPNASSSAIDLSGASVSMYWGSTSIPINAVNIQDSAGTIPDDGLVWEPDLSFVGDVAWVTDFSGNALHADLTGHDETVRVEITGIVGASQADYTYFVTLMDL